MKKPIIFLIFLLVFGLFVINVDTIFGQSLCRSDDIDYVLESKWIPLVKLCFLNENKILFLDKETPFYFLSVVNQTAKDIRLYLVHESHKEYFEQDGQDFQRMLIERKEVGLKEDHLHGVSDRVHSFSFGLVNATQHTIICNQNISKEGHVIDELGCTYPYELSGNVTLTVPGKYYFAVKMMTLDGKIRDNPLRELDVKVLSYDEKVALQANEKFLSDNTDDVINKEKNESFWDEYTIIIILGIISSLIATGIIIASVKLLSKKKNLEKDNLEIHSLDFGLDVETFFERDVVFIRIRNNNIRTYQDCLVLCNDVPCMWWDNNSTSTRNIYSGGGANARIPVNYLTNPKITIKSKDKIIFENPFNDISLSMP